ncbi:MAG: amino acid permease, partial [Nocardioidaceae bacterium]
MSQTTHQEAAPATGQRDDQHRTITGRKLYFYLLGDDLGSGNYALIGVMALQVGGAFWTSFVVG